MCQRERRERDREERVGDGGKILTFYMFFNQLIIQALLRLPSRVTEFLKSGKEAIVISHGLCYELRTAGNSPLRRSFKEGWASLCSPAPSPLPARLMLSWPFFTFFILNLPKCCGALQAFYLLPSVKHTAGSRPKSAAFDSSQPPACTLNEHIRLPLTDQISIVWLHPQGSPASKNCSSKSVNSLSTAVVKCPSLPQIIRRERVTTCRVICHLHAQPCPLCSFLVWFNLLVLFPKIFLRHFLTYPRLTLNSLISPVATSLVLGFQVFITRPGLCRAGDQTKVLKSLVPVFFLWLYNTLTHTHTNTLGEKRVYLASNSRSQYCRKIKAGT